MAPDSLRSRACGGNRARVTSALCKSQLMSRCANGLAPDRQPPPHLLLRLLPVLLKLVLVVQLHSGEATGRSATRKQPPASGAADGAVGT